LVFTAQTWTLSVFAHTAHRAAGLGPFSRFFPLIVCVRLKGRGRAWLARYRTCLLGACHCFLPARAWSSWPGQFIVLCSESLPMQDDFGQMVKLTRRSQRRDNVDYRLLSSDVLTTISRWQERQIPSFGRKMYCPRPFRVACMKEALSGDRPALCFWSKALLGGKASSHGCTHARARLPILRLRLGISPRL
jgi:hypothetical protein